LSIQCMSRRDLSVKGGTSERCYRTRRGRRDEQRYAITSPYFDGGMKMNGPYPEITNISFLEGASVGCAGCINSQPTRPSNEM
jgi:hypothetical protein